MNFCKDCKHSMGDIQSMTCEHPNNTVPSTDEAKYLVTGIEQPVVMARRGSSCAALRLRRDPETLKTVCGPEGKWFEAKQ